ncbi:MAG TPA: PfkB family carbohydrate kinase [Methylomirabilota bacterium]|jgi:hypothetical protein|nr:PfkB family carbohydrate kinase [Methylomirabilota bacterium]
MAAPEFVSVGHITLDRFGDVVRPGGAALYTAVTAHRLGLSAGILTSHGDDFPLEVIPPQIEVVSVPAGETTLFEHDAREENRTMRVLATAGGLGIDDLPQDWRDATMAMLAPVVDEVDERVAAGFSEASLGAQAQGWLRAFASDGTVGTRPWLSPAVLLGRLQALFLSAEDVRGQEAAVLEWMQLVPVGVVTVGRHGALLYVNGERYDVRPRPARLVDATGAGDVFAAAFLVEYHRHGDPWEAAEAATCAASLSVEGEGWSAVPDADTLAAALKDYRRS